MNAKRQSGRQGFTLIEMLLAIGIFAVVLVAIHMVFYGAIQLRNKTSETIEQALPLQHALSVIKRDLSNIVLPGGTFFGELQTTPTASLSTNALDSFAFLEDVVPGQSSPAFYTAAGVIQEDLPWGELERVNYFLVPPTNNSVAGKDLVRSVIRNLLPTMMEEPQEQRLLSGVQRISFLYYDGIQWREYWDSTAETNKLPRGIKMELELAQQPADRLVPAAVELVVPILLQAGTNDLAAADGGEQ